MKRLFKGFTLIELIAIVVIIGILAAIAYPRYQKTKERALGREAVSNLRLILAAERIHRMNNGKYWPDTAWTNSMVDINQNLKLSLSDTNFLYTIDTQHEAFNGEIAINAFRMPNATCWYTLKYWAATGTLSEYPNNCP